MSKTATDNRLSIVYCIYSISLQYQQKADFWFENTQQQNMHNYHLILFTNVVCIKINKIFNVHILKQLPM